MLFLVFAASELCPQFSSEALLHVCLQSNWKKIFKFALLSTVFKYKILTEPMCYDGGLLTGCTMCYDGGLLTGCTMCYDGGLLTGCTMCYDGGLLTGCTMCYDGGLLTGCTMCYDGGRSLDRLYNVL